MAEPAPKQAKPGWTWRSNLVAGLVFAAVGALILGGATRRGVPIPPAFGYVLIALGVLVALGVLNRLRRPA